MYATEVAVQPVHDGSLSPGALPLPTIVILGDFAYVEGGASKVAINEALLLANAGFRVIFLAAVGPADARLAPAGVEVSCLDQHGLLDFRKHPGVAVQAAWNRSAYARTQELLAGLESARTVVHVHGYTKALSTSPIAAAHKMGFKIVCTLHDFFSACPNGAFFDYVRGTPCPRVALSLDCLTTRCDKRHAAHKLFRIARAVTQRTLGQFPSAVHDYITLSQKSADLLRPYLPPAARFHHVANVTDVLQTPLVDVGLHDKILFIGRLEREKGVELLAEAAAATAREVVFVGDGPMRSVLEGRPGVTVTGWLSADDVIAWLDRARCLVFPSLWFETYGLVVDEAAARGVPAIVSDVTAAAERIEDGTTGWHFRSGDADSLAERLRLVSDRDLARSVGRACYDRFWLDHQQASNHVSALGEVYQIALGHDRDVSACRPDEQSV